MSQADAAARLLERLLTDAELRREFRRDPVGSCRAAGLDDIAAEMASAQAKAAHTVDLRESKSSLAGVLMAAAVEGIAIWQVLEHAGAAGGAVADVVQRVTLPAIPAPRLGDVALPGADLGHIALPGSATGGAPGIAATDPAASVGGTGADAAEAAGQASPASGAGDGAGPADGRTPAAAAASASGGDGAGADAGGGGGGGSAAAQTAPEPTDGAGAGAPAGDAPAAQPVAERLAQPDGGPRGEGSGAAADTLQMRRADRAAAGDESGDANASLRFAAPHEPAAARAAAVDLPEPLGDAGPTDYPGDDATPEQYAAWMAAGARERGLPGELPVMASLVESGLKNLSGGDRDSVGFFQMRVGIWNEGAYAGYPKQPDLQLKWFLDQAEAVRKQRIAQGRSVSDPQHFGEWIADVERPAAQYRGRYQFQLGRAQELVRSARDAPPPAAADQPVAARAAAAPSEAAPEAAPADAATTAVEAGRAALENPRLHFDADGVADLKAGRIDPRVLAVLTRLAEDHDLRVSCMRSDHSKLTAGGSISNHWYGRGIDIAAVDGRPVNAANDAARQVAEQLSRLDAAYRPSEIGSPWNLAGPAYFTDAAHQDHLHVGFDDPLPDGWRAPASAAPAVAEPQAARAGAAPEGASPGRGAQDTLSIPVRAERASQGDGAAPDTLGFPAPRPERAAAGAPAGAPVEPRAVRAGAGAASGDGAEAPAAGDGGASAAAGPQALGAVAEAKKYLGTPYLWGGSSPKTGFDCSGLLQWAYAKQGIAIPRVTYDQIDAPGATKVGLHELRPGDLVFFATAAGDVHHVGMSLGGDRFIHAPHTGDVVKISRLSEPYYREQFVGGRRFDHATPTPAAEPAPSAPAPEAVAAAERQRIADEVAAQQPDSLVFRALERQEASHAASTLQFRAARRDGGPS